MNITIEQLTKQYRGGINALTSLDLTIGNGMFGLLGPNGAGKTTLLRILATLLEPTSGRVRVDGIDITTPDGRWAVRRLLGYLPQELGLYDELSPREFLDYIGTLKLIHDPRERAAQVARLLSITGLESVATRRIKRLSGGMKRRVGIAQALLGDPKLLIVDEPTVGLDPEERVRFRTLLAQLAGDRIVLLSTHIVEDIATTCRTLALLHEGRLLFQGAPSALVASAAGQSWTLSLPHDELPNPLWRVVSSVYQPEGLALRIVGPQPQLSATSVPPTLEEAYLALMGRQSAASHP